MYGLGEAKLLGVHHLNLGPLSFSDSRVPLSNIIPFQQPLEVCSFSLKCSILPFQG